ncbi:MAG: phosphoglucosamine mutase [Planctomycetota bacterium]
MQPEHPNPNNVAPLMVSVSGCRGITGESFTEAVAERFALAALHEMREHGGQDPTTIVVGRDGRRGGEHYQRALMEALVRVGCRVIDVGAVPTPTVGAAVRHHDASGAFVLTASHNPQEWLGLKPIDANAGAMSPERSKRLIGRYHAESYDSAPRSGGDVIADALAASRHVAGVVAHLESLQPIGAIRAKRFAICVDSVSSSGIAPARLLAEALNCSIEHLHADASGIFPHTPEPVEANLQQLCAATRANGCAVGFAQDPDADRLAIVDENGRYIGEEYTLALCARAMLGAMDDPSSAVLVANLSTSRMIDDVCTSFGARVERAAVGEANVVSVMRAHDAPLGGEGNGGVIWPDIVPIRDSVGSMALVLALLTREDKPLSEIVDAMPPYAIVKRKTPLEGLDANAVLDAVRAMAGDAFPGAAVNDSDGVRLDFDAPSGGRAWVHVRSSNTEPIMRLIAEAPSRSDADAILDRVETRAFV